MASAPVLVPSSGSLVFGVGDAIATLAGNLTQSSDIEYSADIVEAKDNNGFVISEAAINPKTDVSFTALCTATVAATPPTILAVVAYTPTGGTATDMTVRSVSVKKKNNGFVELSIKLRVYTGGQGPIPA